MRIRTTPAGRPTRAVIHLVLAAQVLHLVPSAPAADLKWTAASDHRRAPLTVHGDRRAGFERVDARTAGIQFTNGVAARRAFTNRNLLNGSGVAAGDVDGDGLCDLYFCGIDPSNALYRNLGNWRFEDITEAAGVACENQDSTGATFADVDGDGDLDLLVTSLGRGVRLFANDGRGRFREITDEAGLRSDDASTSMALGDIDGDGDLDLYVANYRLDTIADQYTTTFRVQTIGGVPVVTHVNNQPASLPQWTDRFEVTPSGRVVEQGQPDALYVNDGGGRFSRVSFTGGAFLDEDGRPLARPPRDWGLAVQMHDFNLDGAPDIYVCNDFESPDRIWINDGTGRFRTAPRLAFRTISAFSMGVDFADVDRDGDVDLFILDMLSPDRRRRHVQVGQSPVFRRPVGMIEDRPQVSRNTLQLNRGDGTFAEVAFWSGVEASDWSWCVGFLDVDLDGYEDILVTNGHYHDMQNADAAARIDSERGAGRLMREKLFERFLEVPTLETPNAAFRNRGDGTFEPHGPQWGFATVGISQGMAFVDLDNDGDMDVVVNNLNRPPELHRNLSTAPRVAVRLHGRAPNRAGIGARIRVIGGPVMQSQEMISGGRYLSGDQAQRVFAALADTLRVEVTWRSGARQSIEARPNHVYELFEADEPAGPPRPPEPVIAALFEEAGEFESAPHVEPAFDDLLRQPLLVRYLSQLGPGVCWHDIDGDGWDDLAVATGAGGHLQLWRNQQGKALKPIRDPHVARPVPRDQTTVLGTARMLVAGSSNYEDGSPQGGLIRLYDLERGATGESLLGHAMAVGPLAMADVDGDGDLDLFAGSRSRPARYPEADASILFRNAEGRFLPDQEFDAGMVSGAVFSDLDMDGFPELLLATEWGPIRVFQRVNDRFEERTDQWGLSEFTGWWNGIATGDLDGDGRPEIIAANWGLNTRHRTSPAHPLRLYHGDFNGDGIVDLVEGRFDPAENDVMPERTFDIVRAALPHLQATVPSFDAYSRMSVAEIHGEPLRSAGILEVRTLATTMFSWRDGRFVPTPLPAEAQWAPAMGVIVADFDGDGTEDVFLSQNVFALAPTESRADAGRGLLLRGDGRGGLEPVPGHESGIAVYGEQRGCAIADLDRDGRVDLAVAQNGNVVRLFRNARAKPALRIRLAGSPQNPAGVGASLRAESQGRIGPAREVQAGSGYWSQNSPVQVMAGPSGGRPERVHVRWPGGREFVVDIPEGASEVEVRENGTVARVR